mmetsp:Transcript_34635/g.80420  ORF Transcript_34635/g.80420 Transcript_34635/m.80420 type:complete len:423 (+) Transcript_34635:3-1271(+)
MSKRVASRVASAHGDTRCAFDDGTTLQLYNQAVSACPATQPPTLSVQHLLHVLLVFVLVLLLDGRLLALLLLPLLLLLLLDVLLGVAVVAQAAQAHLEAPPRLGALERGRSLEEVALDAVLLLHLHAVFLLGSLGLRCSGHRGVGVLALQQQLDLAVQGLRVELCGVGLLDEAPQLHGPLATPVCHPLDDAVPVDALVRLSIHALTDDLTLLVGSAVLQLESEVRAPSIPKARVQRHSSVEPLARLGVLAVAPEELGHSNDDVRVVLTLLQRVDALGVLALLGLQLDRLGPHETAGGALLQRAAHEVVRQPLAAIEHLHLHTLQPEQVRTGVAQTCFLQQRACLGVALLPDLALHSAEPKWHAAWAPLQPALKEAGSLVQLRRRLLHVDLTADHPHLGERRVLLQALLTQVQRLLEKPLLSL